MLNFFKIKNSSAKDTPLQTERERKRIKTQVTDWDRIFAKYISDNVPVSKIHGDLLNLTIRKQTIQLKMGKRFKQWPH